MTYQFQAFNRLIDSDLYFPELPAIKKNELVADVTITYGNVPVDGLALPLKSGPFFQANQRNFWLNVPKIARFLVMDGQQILIDPCSNIDEETLRIFILESCFKALLSQQNYLVLEGSAIEMGGHAVLFLAPSGFGKSTVASLFLKRGYTVLTDEICAIDHKLCLLPGFSSINLWASIATQLDIDLASLKTMRPSVEKYRLDWERKADLDILPIKLIYLLDYHKKENLVLNDVPANVEANLLVEVTPPYLFQSTKTLADNVPMVKLTLPRWDYDLNQLGFLLSPLLDTIEKDAHMRILA